MRVLELGFLRFLSYRDCFGRIPLMTARLAFLYRYNRRRAALRSESKFTGLRLGIARPSLARIGRFEPIVWIVLIYANELCSRRQLDQIALSFHFGYIEWVRFVNVWSMHWGDY